MDIATIFLIALGLAMDAFSVALAGGVYLKNNPKLVNALKAGIFFGVFQFGMLFIGNLLGSTFSSYIEFIDHWIAFFLLMFIGGKMLIEAIKDEEAENNQNPFCFKTLTVLSIATSIDALAVGVSISTMTNNILFDASVVGIVAFLLSFAGVYIGNKCGNIFGRKAEIAGGIVLMGIGIKILIEHLFF